MQLRCLHTVYKTTFSLFTVFSVFLPHFAVKVSFLSVLLNYRHRTGLRGWFGKQLYEGHDKICKEKIKMALMGESGVRKQMGHWKKSNVKNLATLSHKRATCLRY
jgi:hypothetical protein